MTMRESKHGGSHTWYTAQHERKLRRHAKPAGGGFDPNEASRLSVSNFAPAALTSGSWQQLVFDATEESVGTDLSLDTSTGTVTVNSNGIYSVGSQLQMSAAPANSFITLSIEVSGTALDAYMRHGQNVTIGPDYGPDVSVHFLPYFIGAGETIRIFAAANYTSGTSYTPDFTTLWIQRIS